MALFKKTVQNLILALNATITYTWIMKLCHGQCDQMARLFVKGLAIFNNKSFP